MSRTKRQIGVHFRLKKISSGRKSKMVLRDWLLVQLEQKRKKLTAGTVMGYVSLMHILDEYGDSVPMRNIDKDYCLGFIDFLRTTYTVKQNVGQHLNEATVNHYFEIFTAVLNAAVREGLLKMNPMHCLESSERPHRVESTRTFLTIEEVKRLISTPAKRDDVKQAFLFSCFCGLRWSDVSRLAWGNIEKNNGRHYANIVMKKTREALYLPLNGQARQFMPKQPKNAGTTDLVFNTLPVPQTVNRILDIWAKAAGITKKVSFHVARHTFATTSLTLGADLYTTSKLLGHSNISVTQVYAKIINSKKDEAVDLFDKFF